MAKYVIGNWKMNGTADLLDEFFELVDFENLENVALCVPHVLLEGGEAFGAQDCSAHKNGAFTGEVSAEMIAGIGATYVIVGHSERRINWNETDDVVSQKATRALESKLIPIICVGETLEERESGSALAVLEKQAMGSLPEGNGKIIVAYEPRWSVGAGKIPALPDIEKAHDHIRSGIRAAGFRDAAVIYGGGVRPDNAAGILALDGVDGVLVGGASLNVEDFKGIIDARK